MSKNIIYLHGLGSKGDSLKSRELRNVFTPLGVNIIAPDLPIDPTHVRNLVDSIVKSIDDIQMLSFCGTSLGGFYASFFGEVYDAPYVIVNPALNPSKTFLPYVTNPPPDFSSGGVLTITENDLKYFSVLESRIAVPTGTLANVFLAKDDKVIPYKAALEKFKYATSLTVTETGGHRFESEWNLVVERLKQIMC